MTIAFPGGRWAPRGRFVSLESFGASATLFNTDGGGSGTVPLGIHPFDQWHDIDFHDGAHWGGLDPEFPDGHVDAMKAVFIQGIVTTGGNGSTDNQNVFIAWRAKGDNHRPSQYQWQTRSNNIIGSRYNVSIICPVRDGVIQTYWHRDLASISCGYTVRMEGYWL